MPPPRATRGNPRWRFLMLRYFQDPRGEISGKNTTLPTLEGGRSAPFFRLVTRKHLIFKAFHPSKIGNIETGASG